MDAKTIRNKVAFLGLYSVYNEYGQYDDKYIEPYCKYLFPQIQQDEKIIIPVYCRAKITGNSKFKGVYPTLIFFTNKRVILGYKAMLGLFKGLEILDYSNFTSNIEINSKQKDDVLVWKGTNGVDLEFGISRTIFEQDPTTPIDEKKTETVVNAIRRIMMKYEIDRSVVGKGDETYDHAVELYEGVKKITDLFNEYVKSKLALSLSLNLSETEKELLKAFKYTEFLKEKGIKDEYIDYEI